MRLFRNKQKLYSESIQKYFAMLDYTGELSLYAKKQCSDLFFQIEKLKLDLNQIMSQSLNQSQDDIKNKIFLTLNIFFKKAERIEKTINDEVLIHKLKKIFKDSTIEFINQSEFMKHGYLKPRGYAGDYQIVEAMYNLAPISKDIGLYLDQYFLQVDYVQAVRDRKDKMKEILKDYIKSFPDETMKILNLACGSCREIKELSDENFVINKTIFLTLVDQDAAALEFSENRLKTIAINWHLKFIRENILNYLKNKEDMKLSLGGQNLIYSIGLADYLPDSILGPMANRCFQALEFDGLLVLAHKNVRYFTSPISDWGADWKFIPRSHRELLNLIKRYLNGELFSIKSYFEKNNRIFFLFIKKLNK